jgi:hypothetical protein
LADELAETPDERPRPECAAQSVGGLDDARLSLRAVGYCVLCERLVERNDDGTCAAGHPAEAIHGLLLLTDDEPVPVLPRFNLAAFLVPLIWGPAHGQWVGALFLPIWLFADSAIVSAARRGGLMWIAAFVVAAGTIGFMYFFARHANGVAFRRVIGRLSVGEYLRRERIWALVAVPAAAAMLGWAIYFDLVLAPVLRF